MDNVVFENCLKDLYELGIIQGEHNINWADEYNLLEYSKTYYEKSKAIADKYAIKYNTCLEDYREEADDEEYLLWDRSAFDMHEMIQKHILNIISHK